MFDFFKKKPYFIGKEGSKITLKQFGYMTVEIGHAESLNTINNGYSDFSVELSV